MEEMIKLEMTRAEAEQFKTLVDKCLEEIDAANERMDHREAEIARLSEETRLMLKQIKALLNVETDL